MFLQTIESIIGKYHGDDDILVAHRSEELEQKQGMKEGIEFGREGTYRLSGPQEDRAQA
eukprot:gene32599-42219_t